MARNSHRIGVQVRSMKCLLGNEFAPITFTCGFVERPFAEVSSVFSKWQKEIATKFGIGTEESTFVAPLADALLRLQPLTSPLDRYLLIETRSPWTAIFANGLRANDVHSPVSYLPRVLKCRGLEAVRAPDRSDKQNKDAIRVYGAIVFALYGAEQTDWLNRIRRIAITNDVGGWEFAEEGQVQHFEKAENYRKRKITDRFTSEMLESYCAALGIALFDEGFYGGNCLVSRVKRTTPPGPSMSIAEARAHLYL